MSIYWKQSLWLGGVYWLASLVLAYVDTFESYFTDFILSLLLTIFLIPMNFLKPVKWIEKAMRKLPITATFLVFVGWVPYVSIVIFLSTVLYGVIALAVSNINIDGLILTLITPMSILAVIKIACIIFSFVLAAFFVFVNKKSIVGCLNNKFKLVDGDACNMPIEEEEVVEQVKKVSKIKKAASKKEETTKKENTKKKVVKKTARKAVKKKVVEKN